MHKPFWMTYKNPPIIIAAVLLAFIPFHLLLAVAIITNTETVANVSLSTLPAITFAGGVTEVKASRTLDVDGIPLDGASFTIGTCVVSFSESVGDEFSCSDNSATISTIGLFSESQVATAIRSLTNVSDTGHGSLTVGGPGGFIVFTTSGTESSATVVTFSENTSGAISNFTSISGVVGVAASASATVPAALIASAADQSLTIDGVTINLGSSAFTATQVAAAIAGTTFTSGTSYVANGAYTVSNSGANLTFTRSGVGAGGNNGLTVSDANYGGRAQTVTFAPSGFDGSNYTYSITINSTSYSFTSDSTSVQTIVEGLSGAAASDPAVSCTENDIILTCVADTPGTAFTYSSSVTESASDGSIITASGSAGWRREQLLSQNVSSAIADISNTTITGKPENYTPDPNSPALSSGGDFDQSLEFGFVGNEVSRIQKWLSLWPTIYPEKLVTGFYGSLTKQAVTKFQLVYGVIQSETDPGAGVFGPHTRALVNSAFLLNQNKNINQMTFLRKSFS